MTNFIFQYHICFRQPFRTVLAIVTLLSMNNIAHAQQQEMMVRISEIAILPEHLDDYKAILKEEAEASVRLEKGVIAIFPMSQKDTPTQVRILEMYNDKQAYQFHLKTEHFLKYKTTTLHMVKSLKIIDMETLYLETAIQILKKMPAKPKSE